jgi:hypothetical protein
MRKIYQCVNFSDGCKPDAVIVSLALVFALALAPAFALGLVAIVVVIVSAACMLVIILLLFMVLTEPALAYCGATGRVSIAGPKYAAFLMKSRRDGSAWSCC